MSYRFEVLIISYLPPPTETIGSIRRAAHTKQIDWLRRYLPSARITVLAQNYLPSDYDRRVEYVRASGPVMGSAGARNKLLDGFYAGATEWCMFMDNDSVLDERHEDLAQFFSFMESGDLRGIDIFSPIDPSKMPFTKMHEQERETLDKSYKFSRSASLKTSVFFLRNLQRAYNRRLLFTLDMPTCVDTVFGYDAIRAGLSVYRIDNLVLKTYCHAQTTILAAYPDLANLTRDAVDKVQKHKIQKRFGFKLTSAGGLNTRDFLSRYANYPTQILKRKEAARSE